MKKPDFKYFKNQTKRDIILKYSKETLIDTNSLYRFEKFYKWGVANV